MRSSRKLLLVIVFLTIISFIIDLPKNYHFKFAFGKLKIDQVISAPAISLPFLGFYRDLDIKKGLDLAGGVHLVLQADMKDIAPSNRDTALDSVREIVERRVNLYGVSEPIVQSSKTSTTYRLIVELPGVSDVNQAISLVGQTASLEFREFAQDSSSATLSAFLVPTLSNTKPVSISGKELESARVEFDPQTGKPVVAFVLTDAGSKKFEQVTKRLLNQPLAIFLDDLPISWPTVQAVITKSGVISGNFTTQQAKQLSLQLSAGALPVPIKIMEQRNIGAMLGAESINKSLTAGLIGLLLVAAFMLLNYGFRGLLADLALVIYTLLTLALFKLIPVTLTLAGIAGFILSIGMAVDANILIFERIKEELRLGKNHKDALEFGFRRAWTSIRDSNVSSLITCAILYWFGTGLVRGFALTLAMGILVSMFSAITITRTFLRLVVK